MFGTVPLNVCGLQAAHIFNQGKLGMTVVEDIQVPENMAESQHKCLS